MEFVGYTSEPMLDLTKILLEHNGNYVFTDCDIIYLAINIGQINGIEDYALFLWDDFNEGDEDNNRIIIQNKAKDTIKFFHETVGLVNSVCPRQIYNEVQTILGFNGSDEVYQNNGYTDIICSNDIVCLEKDFSRDLWFVKIKDITTYVLKNEASAKRIYQLILKDISNFIDMRWRG